MIASDNPNAGPTDAGPFPTSREGHCVGEWEEEDPRFCAGAGGRWARPVCPLPDVGGCETAYCVRRRVSPPCQRRLSQWAWLLGGSFQLKAFCTREAWYLHSN